MKVPAYLAAASSEGARARRYADALEATGLIELTSRWFEHCEDWSGNDHKLGRSAAHNIAQRQRDAINRARIIWVLWPSEKHFTAATIEFGIALDLWTRRRDVSVYASGSKVEETIFTALCVRHVSDDITLDAITYHARDVLERWNPKTVEMPLGVLP